MSKTLSQTIAEFVVSPAVPADAIEKSSVAIADTIGCALAGTTEEGTAILRRTLAGRKNWGSATVIGTGERMSPREAALINGTAAHALDFDDINWTLYGHPSVAVLPAALAVAEDTGASGKALIEAYAIGVEVAAKIGRFANPGLYVHGWHATCAIGSLGAAAAVARLLKLDAKATAYALGIAASMSAGVRRNFGSMVKPFHAGRAGETGVLAGELAKGGFDSDPEALEGRFGFFQVFSARSTPTSAEMAAVLGKPWDVVDPGIVIKRYPACGATHCAIDAILELRDEHRFTDKDIAEIRVGAEPLALKVLLHARPKTGLEGKFSMQFCAAIAAVDGVPRLAHFAEKWVTDKRVTDLIERTKVYDRTDLGGPVNDAVPAAVDIVLKDGRTLSRTVSVPLGDPRNPMSERELAGKFVGCATPVLGESKAKAAWEALGRLDRFASMDDMRPALAAS